MDRQPAAPSMAEAPHSGARPEARRTAVVTGGSGLIGSALCEALTDRGCQVVSLDTADTCSENGLLSSMRADISDDEQLVTAFHDIRHRVGPIDWLVHAAALTGANPAVNLSGALADIEMQRWRSINRVNVDGTLACVQQALKAMEGSRDRRIVLIGSIQGVVPTLGSGAYAVTKGLMQGLARQLAAELAGEGIPVNVVCPGTTVANGVPGRPGWPNPMGRFVTPGDIADTVVAQLTLVSSMMTGVVIPVDGGEHLRPRGDPQRVRGGGHETAI